MSKRKTRDILAALDIAGATQPPATATAAGLSHGSDTADETKSHRPGQRRRGLREQRVGIVVHVDKDTDYTLKRLALESCAHRP